MLLGLDCMEVSYEPLEQLMLEHTQVLTMLVQLALQEHSCKATYRLMVVQNG